MPGRQAKPSDTLPDFSGITTLDERYHLLRVIGSGAFGKVYQAIDRVTISPTSPFVAIKCVQKPEPGSRREQCLMRELNLHRKVCSHDNIVTVRDQFATASYFFMVMDFCNGDLHSALNDGRFYNNEELIKNTMVQLIDALQYCHEQNVQHQDLKPANILFGRDGQVYLADFGVATEAAISQSTGCGTVPYSSPEAVGTIETYLRPFSTVHADIWALGIILVNLITGRSPWNKAVSTDDEFVKFTKDREFLYKTLSISEAAHKILRSVFAMNPFARTPLPELREQILAVDTFWKSNMEPHKRLPYTAPPTPAPINLDLSSLTSDSNFGPLTPPANAFELEIQVQDLSADQDISEPSISRRSRASSKISSRCSRFLKRAAKVMSVV
ncbi:kinase-like domain-containing protein [Mycena floridula]|nr:kinase-like domain-containing protein [Mycena floridula]